MDTTSGNRAIALFEGLRLITKEEFLQLGEHSYTGENEGTKWGLIEYLNYHSDWNQLMPVVEHIESLGYDTEVKSSTWSTDKMNQMTIYTKEYRRRKIVFKSHEDKKTSVWLAVVAFIQWFNEKGK